LYCCKFTAIQSIYHTHTHTHTQSYQASSGGSETVHSWKWRSSEGGARVVCKGEGEPDHWVHTRGSYGWVKGGNGLGLNFPALLSVSFHFLHCPMLYWVVCCTPLRNGGICRKSPGCGPGQSWDMGEEPLQALCGGGVGNSATCLVCTQNLNISTGSCNWIHTWPAVEYCCIGTSSKQEL